MGYPSAVATFGTKNAGDTIQPSHINDLQTEVTAMESALVTGPISLPAVSAQSLSVTGGSTFASTIAISTQTYIFPSSRATAGDVLTVASTSGSTATLQWRAPTGFAPITARLSHSANQEVLSAAWTGLNFDTEDEDASGLHSTSANSSRLTFVSTGMYLVGANVDMSIPTAGGDRRGRIVINDSTTVIGGVEVAGVATITVAGISVMGTYRAASATDYATVQVFQGSGSTATALGNSTVYGGTRFWACKVG